MRIGTKTLSIGIELLKCQTNWHSGKYTVMVSRCRYLEDEQIRDRKYPICGYAPGGYMCRCKDCSIIYDGDKRSWRCLDCALIEQQRLIDDNMGAGI